MPSRYTDLCGRPQTRTDALTFAGYVGTRYDDLGPLFLWWMIITETVNNAMIRNGGGDLARMVRQLPPSAYRNRSQIDAGRHVLMWARGGADRCEIFLR